MIVLVVVEAMAIGLLGLLVAGLLRSHAEILRALHDLGAGLGDPSGVTSDVELRRRVAADVPAPRTGDVAAHDVVGVTPDDAAVAVAVTGTEGSTLLAFLTTGCLTCAEFWQAFGRGEAHDLPGGARLVVVTKGGAEESESRVRDLAPAGITTVMSTHAWADYAVEVAPYFVYVDGPSGRIVGEGAAGNWGQVQSLFTQAVTDADIRAARAHADPDQRGALLARADAQREARADEALARAGIGPGHPSLYPANDSETAEAEGDHGRASPSP